MSARAHGPRDRIRSALKHPRWRKRQRLKKGGLEVVAVLEPMGHTGASGGLSFPI